MKKKIVTILGVMGIILGILGMYLNHDFEIRHLLKSIELVIAAMLIWIHRDKISSKIVIIYFSWTTVAMIIILLGFFNVIPFEVFSFLLVIWATIIIGISVYGYCKNTGISFQLVARRHRNEK